MLFRNDNQDEYNLMVRNQMNLGILQQQQQFTVSAMTNSAYRDLSNPQSILPHSTSQGIFK